MRETQTMLCGLAKNLHTRGATQLELKAMLKIALMEVNDFYVTSYLYNCTIVGWYVSSPSFCEAIILQKGMTERVQQYTDPEQKRRRQR